MWRLSHAPSDTASRLAPAFWAWLLWAGAGASLVFWALQTWQLAQPRPQALAEPAVVNAVAASAGAWRVLQPVTSSPVPGADAGAASPVTSWQLLGVAAGGAGRGSALLVRPGEPARTWMVGQSLDGQWLLQRVAPGRAWLVPADQPGGQTLELTLPQTPPPGPASAPARPD